jgi:subfamily B ATP-binding cassette protein MsbA
LGGLRIIKAFGAEKNRTAHFASQNDQLVKTQNSIALRREAASPTSEVLGVAVLCVILWFGSRMVFNGEIPSGIFIMFILIFTQLLDPLKKLSQFFYSVARGKASIERINKIRTAINPIVDGPNAKPFEDFTNEIEFKNVDFGYGENKVLKNINLTIKKGQSLALVGASGAGKSTLADLIPRFHEVTNGEILIDGVNIKDYKIDDLRHKMGIVSQEPILFNDSIENNIALGQEVIDYEKVAHSCEVANANFVNEKEEGLKTNIGDRGMKLSGGEKQRLTIARAIYKNPPILILDEATSSLDTVSERIVQEAIHKLMKNRTSIVIAHRLSTIQNADEIIVLEKGKIKERGKHNELLAQNGIYSKLVKMQYITKSEEK